MGKIYKAQSYNLLDALKQYREETAEAAEVLCDILFGTSQSTYPANFEYAWLFLSDNSFLVDVWLFSIGLGMLGPMLLQGCIPEPG